jgi:hypothetical protein
MSERNLSESLFFEANEENKQNIAKINKNVEILLERSESLFKRLDELPSPKPATPQPVPVKAEPVDKEKQKKDTEQFLVNLQAAIAKPLTPVSKQIEDLKESVDKAIKARLINWRITIQWVESKGVLSVIALLVILLSLLLWDFNLKIQIQKNEDYYTMYRIIRANGGVTAGQLEYVKTMVCTPGHEEKKAELIKFADNFEVQWNARQDSLIRVKEAKKIR